MSKIVFEALIAGAAIFLLLAGMSFAMSWLELHGKVEVIPMLLLTCVFAGMLVRARYEASEAIKVVSLQQLVVWSLSAYFVALFGVFAVVFLVQRWRGPKTETPDQDGAQRGVE